jgi:hypothetical protein
MVKVIWLAATAAAATSTKRLNRFPRLVTSRRFAATTIRDDAKVM